MRVITSGSVLVFQVLYDDVAHEASDYAELFRRTHVADVAPERGDPRSGRHEGPIYLLRSEKPEGRRGPVGVYVQLLGIMANLGMQISGVQLEGNFGPTALVHVRE